MEGCRGVVLLVEDNTVFRQVLARILNGEGFVVAECGSAHEALATLRAAGPADVIIADLGIPGRNDLTIRAELYERTASTPTLFISGHSREEAEARYGIHPDDEFLAKPFAISDLLQTLRRLLTPRTE